MTWAQEYQYVEPLRDVRGEPDLARHFRAELLREVSPGHVLHGLDVEVIAEAIPQDEVIVETSTGEVALVHLTCSGRPESPPWPNTKMVESAEDLEALIEFRY